MMRVKGWEGRRLKGRRGGVGLTYKHSNIKQCQLHKEVKIKIVEREVKVKVLTAVQCGRIFVVRYISRHFNCKTKLLIQ